MIRFLLMFLLSFSFCAVGAAAGEPSDVQNKSYWMCKSKKQVRTIRVHIDDKNICETFYSRDGGEKKVGSGRNHESCMKFLDNIKVNLEKQNWSCRDITDTKMTSLE